MPVVRPLERDVLEPHHREVESRLEQGKRPDKEL
jgi:hypothetical protein